MEELKQLIAATANTLRTIRTDDRDDNWNKLVAIKTALGRMLAMIDEMEGEKHGEDD